MLHLPLIHTLLCWVLARWHQVPFFESLVWLDFGLNPSLLDHGRTLYSLGQWPSYIYIYIYIYIYMFFLADHSQRLPFNSYYIEVWGFAPPFPRLLHTLDLYLIMLSVSKVVSNTIFWVFGMTQPGIEPQSPRPLVNTQLIRPMARLYIYTYIHIYFFLLTIIKGSLFNSYYTEVWEGCSSFTEIAPHPWSYLIMLSVKQGGIKYHFLSLWYDLTWDWTPVSRTISKHSTYYTNVSEKKRKEAAKNKRSNKYK